MIAVVSIEDDGAVCVTVDSSEEAEDEDARTLAGLVLDDMLARAAGTALDTWLKLRTGTGDDGAAE
jgi:hypothetical protein